MIGGECVMCEGEAEFIAVETREPLRERCNEINNTIRNQKGLHSKYIYISN